MALLCSLLDSIMIYLCKHTGGGSRGNIISRSDHVHAGFHVSVVVVVLSVHGTSSLCNMRKHFGERVSRILELMMWWSSPPFLMIDPHVCRVLGMESKLLSGFRCFLDTFKFTF